ncbi:acyl-CoA dehydrogenase family protein [Nocardia terpenica]|uniref:Acyl-CoA dehydrogenase n=1 Tax=Nocardia terpenica TaxID=455432 RepID=A0A6G9YYA5_9NOCA|nr:acyl-CoA dehydrogenase family protein [Nocardia terpenica]QIS18319.1 acyl-CoA dehydrogenase [Nocardia terpenica]
MDLTFTTDQQLIRDTAAELLAARAAEAGVRAVSGEVSGFSRTLWKELVALGWTGLPIAECYGGEGAGFLEACLLLEQLGAHQIPTPYLPSVICAALPIARFGTPEQREEFVGAVVQGRVLSYARAAPRGQWRSEGSEVAATPVADGYRLSGTAWFVPYAEAAEALLVVAEMAGELTAFLVDRAAPGVHTSKLDVVGNEPQYRVEFRAVSVAESRVLGGVHGGRAVAALVCALGAAASCMEMVGGAQRVLDMTVEYARTREQFGRPIGSFQAVQHHCADMAVDVLGARLIAYEAAWRLAEGLPAELEVAVAKAWVGEAYHRVCALGHQVHGAIGFTHEHDLHLYLRHQLACSLAFDDADAHLEHVARALGICSTTTARGTNAGTS